MIVKISAIESTSKRTKAYNNNNNKTPQSAKVSKHTDLAPKGLNPSMFGISFGMDIEDGVKYYGDRIHTLYDDQQFFHWSDGKLYLDAGTIEVKSDGSHDYQRGHLYDYYSKVLGAYNGLVDMEYMGKVTVDSLGRFKHAFGPDEEVDEYTFKKRRQEIEMEVYMDMLRDFAMQGRLGEAQELDEFNKLDEVLKKLHLTSDGYIDYTHPSNDGDPFTPYDIASNAAILDRDYKSAYSKKDETAEDKLPEFFKTNRLPKGIATVGLSEVLRSAIIEGNKANYLYLLEEAMSGHRKEIVSEALHSTDYRKKIYEDDSRAVDKLQKIERTKEEV
ncbi:hypothetical protein IJ531_06275, partial [bacterium]|nr:hypothetical protein [bacterium]